MSQKDLQLLRREIDQIDQHIHDLLAKRVDVVDEIVKEKRKSGGQIIFPAREADLVKKLLSTHQGKFPRKSVFRIWREIIGATTKIQTGDVSVVVPVGDKPDSIVFMELAKDFFSSVLSFKKASNPVSALTMIREGEATFAVMPWPVDGEQKCWWRMFKDEIGEEGLNVIARLPFADEEIDQGHYEHRAVVVARLPFDPSESDRSFVVVDLDQDISRGGLVEKCKKAEMPPIFVYTSPGDSYLPPLHLVEVEGYVAQDDKRLRALEKEIGGPMTRCYRIGGYAEPPQY